MSASKAVPAGVLPSMVTLAGCGGATPETVEGLAHAVPGLRDDAVLAREFEALNSGRTRVDQSVAEQFLAEDGLLAEIRDGADESMGYACSAWDHREILTNVLDSTAQEDLNRIWAAVRGGKVREQTVDFACQVHELKEHLDNP